MKDYVLDHLIKTGRPLTTKNYFEANWGGCDGIETIEDLDAENFALVHQMVERGLLVDTRNPYKNHFGNCFRPNSLRSSQPSRRND
jgi:hypothetical protein